MSASNKTQSHRRRFLKLGSALALGGQTLLQTGSVKAAAVETQEGSGFAPSWPNMAYRTLGRTGFNASRLFFGCGATLSSRRQDRLLHTAYDAGVNVFDVGFRDYYDDAEKHLAPFLKQKRDDVFLISKAYVPIDRDPTANPNSAELKRAAQGWLTYLDNSLRELRVDHVDAYYQMAANNPNVVRSDEMHEAFSRAKAQGKVRFLGLSTHENAAAVLSSAIDSKAFDLAMIAITPKGWYDWENKAVLAGSPPMTALRPLLDTARAAGIGLIGMKAGRFLAGRRFLGRGNETAFDDQYPANLKAAKLSTFQRSYAYVLANGLDAVNADMQNLLHLKENFIAAATAQEFEEVHA